MLGIGALVGAMNGALTAYGRVLPIIVTLDMSYVTRAMIPMDWLLGLNKIARIDLTDDFKVFMLDNRLIGLPILVWIALIMGEITGAVGVTYDVPDVGTLVVEESKAVNAEGVLAPTGGTISYLNKLNEFNAVTVDAWVDIL